MNSAYIEAPQSGHYPDQQEAPVILFDQVAKHYGSLQVLDSLSLQVHRGDVYGFLGRNGAGKSTAIRMMLGITSVSNGTIRLFGQPVTQGAVKTRQRIGYVAQEQNFYPWMSPKQLSRFVRGLYPRWNQQRFERLLEVFELPYKRKIGNFSGGMKAKLALCLAVATGPECLILDEPTAGMDPVARREFLDLVSHEARRSDTTVFFSTHVIDDIESIANRIAIIESGRTVYEGNFTTLADHVASYSIDERDYQPGDVPGDFIHQGSWLLQHGRRQSRVQMVFEFEYPAPEFPPLSPGWQQDPMTLEDVFVAIVAKSDTAELS